MKVYTRVGDDGTTGLFYGGRVAKNAAEPTAYGAVDEAQAAIGMARATTTSGSALDELLVSICRDLYVVMAELATLPSNRDKLSPGRSKVTVEMTTALEHHIDTYAALFDSPTEFSIPGSDPTSAALDFARTVVRRAERDALSVAIEDACVGPYLNRLSDLIWTLARWHEDTFIPAKTTTGLD